MSCYTHCRKLTMGWSCCCGPRPHVHGTPETQTPPPPLVFPSQVPQPPTSLSIPAYPESEDHSVQFCQVLNSLESISFKLVAPVGILLLGFIHINSCIALVQGVFACSSVIMLGNTFLDHLLICSYIVNMYRCLVWRILYLHMQTFSLAFYLVFVIFLS